MSTKETGGSAFPAGAIRKGRERPHDAGSDWVVTERMDPAHGGMTLRDYFAAKAMQGFCADPSNHELFDGYVDMSECAYEVADAMVEARKS